MSFANKGSETVKGTLVQRQYTMLVKLPFWTLNISRFIRISCNFIKTFGTELTIQLMYAAVAF